MKRIRVSKMFHTFKPEGVKEEEISNCEKILLRKGNIITPVGVFRAAMANSGVLERAHFNHLVKINYFLEKEKDLPKEISLKVKIAWGSSKKFFEDLNIIEVFGEDKIIIKNPKECFSI